MEAKARDIKKTSESAQPARAKRQGIPRAQWHPLRERLKKFMEEKGIGDTELARRMGTSQPVVWRNWPARVECGR